MSICIRPHAELSTDTAVELEKTLTVYYQNPPPSYYSIANEASARYTSSEQPFHCDLVKRVSPGMTVLELGCGTAHLCNLIESQGGSYTGVDHSLELLEQNRKRFPNARFFSLESPPSETFDLVASLYTIEHVINPQAYLERLWNFCKPGGSIAVICPDFFASNALPPSLFYGRTPKRLREKVRTFAFVDALQHLLDLKWNAPRWKARAQSSRPGAFWINLKPRILHGAEYSIDADAVHLPRLVDLVWWFEQRGGIVLATSKSIPGVPPAILRYNCYVVAQKCDDLRSASPE